MLDEINATSVELNTTLLRSKEDSFANMIDRALEKEFTENDQTEGLYCTGSELLAIQFRTIEYLK